MEDILLKPDSINIYYALVNSLKLIEQYTTEGKTDITVFSLLNKIYSSHTVDTVLHFICSLIDVKSTLCKEEKVKTCILLYNCIVKWLYGIDTCIKISKPLQEKKMGDTAEVLPSQADTPLLRGMK